MSTIKMQLFDGENYLSLLPIPNTWSNNEILSKTTAQFLNLSSNYTPDEAFLKLFAGDSGHIIKIKVLNPDSTPCDCASVTRTNISEAFSGSLNSNSLGEILCKSSSDSFTLNLYYNNSLINNYSYTESGTIISLTFQLKEISILAKYPNNQIAADIVFSGDIVPYKNKSLITDNAGYLKAIAKKEDVSISTTGTFADIDPFSDKISVENNITSYTAQLSFKTGKQEFSSGVYTLSPLVTSYDLTVIGGGGGGGYSTTSYSSGGGGGGGYGKTILKYSPQSKQIKVLVGSGRGFNANGGTSYLYEIVSSTDKLIASAGGGGGGSSSSSYGTGSRGSGNGNGGSVSKASAVYGAFYINSSNGGSGTGYVFNDSSQRSYGGGGRSAYRQVEEDKTYYGSDYSYGGNPCGGAGSVSGRKPGGGGGGGWYMNSSFSKSAGKGRSGAVYLRFYH